VYYGRILQNEDKDTSRFYSDRPIYNFCTYICLNLKKASLETINSVFIELNSNSFFDNKYFRKCVVLFHVENSELCDIMVHNLNCLAKSKQFKMGFYKLDLDKYPEYGLKYNILGVPTILMLDKNEEIKRIMGVVSEQNLRKIYNKDIR